MKYLSQNIPKDKRVLLRTDYNVPIAQGTITDTTRIKDSLPTLELLLKNNNRVIILTHLGRPKGIETALSLEPVRVALQTLLLEKKVILVKNLDDVDAFANQTPSEIILVENIRFFPGEEANDPAFAKKLAALGDVFVNDAFSFCHRSTASMIGLTEYLPSYCGLALEKELNFLTKLSKNPKRPFVAITGGGKISTKLTLLASLAVKADKVLVGGGIANNLLKASGNEIGGSIAEPSLLPEAEKLLKQHADKFLLPQDVVVLKPDHSVVYVDVDRIEPEDRIEDIGEKTRESFRAEILNAGTVVWNGPVGEFEKEEFSKGTHAVLQAISESNAVSIVGGGDTLAAIAKYPKLAAKISFISTGGGALLEYIENGTLPGIDALEKNIS